MTDHRAEMTASQSSVEIPPEYLPEGVSGAFFDPAVLRSAADAHCRHSFDHDMPVKAWVVLWLLDQWDATNNGTHMCLTEEDGWRPCPASLCEATLLSECVLDLKGELSRRRECLVGARDDLAAIEGGSAEDGGIWMRAVAQNRRGFVEAAIANTDAALDTQEPAPQATPKEGGSVV